jgi:hypothetical protein
MFAVALVPEIGPGFSPDINAACIPAFNPWGLPSFPVPPPDSQHKMKFLERFY